MRLRFEGMTRMYYDLFFLLTLSALIHSKDVIKIQYPEGGLCRRISLAVLNMTHSACPSLYRKGDSLFQYPFTGRFPGADSLGLVPILYLLSIISSRNLQYTDSLNFCLRPHAPAPFPFSTVLPRHQRGYGFAPDGRGVFIERPSLLRRARLVFRGVGPRSSRGGGH
jgi:hypothetical protein